MRSVSEQVIVDRLAAIGRPSPLLVISGNFGTPWEARRLADDTLPTFRAFVLNPQPGWPCRDGFILETPFVGPGARKDPRLEYLPMRLSLVPRLFDSLWPPDAVLIHTSPPRGGKVSLGIEVDILPAAIEQVRRRWARRRPGEPPHAPLRAATLWSTWPLDLALEVDVPFLPLAVARPTRASTAIGEPVARYAVDGGTLQLGIGQMPDTAAHHLRRRRRLGVWSEMVSDSVLRLEQDGAPRPRPGDLRLVPLRVARALRLGRRQSPPVMRRTEVVNDPGTDCRAPRYALGQHRPPGRPVRPANASYVHGTIYSALRRPARFVVGALHSKGGHAVVCLRSWHDKSSASTVVPA